MLATAKLLGWIFEKLGQPIVLGQILGGLIIGVFTESNEIIREFSNLGALILLFLAGIESDLQEFKRVGKPSIFVAGVGVASILGAYMVGLIIGQTSYRKQVEDHVSILGYSLFIPLFFVEVGMRIELNYILHASFFAVLYTAMAIVSKVAGCGMGAYLAGFDLKASLRIGIGMIPRLGVELAMLTIALSSGVIGPEALTIAIFMVFVTTISTPPLLKWAYKL
ncbi:cation:proton antiporter [Thermococcus sp. 2319x1]|uniref:cation:proton antiporter n=1 Tax=Thermococcus sp. 2319x1 TaxID=1674923 RepID=UPI00158155D1|nr:cation:proton antiporter [Thermococcus sp. 2319x1]